MSPKHKQEEIIIKSNVEKQNYKKTVIECNKLRNLIKTEVGRNITIISKQEYDNVSIEYGENINGYVISKGNDAIDDI